ncbi:MAG: galactose oxidase-like domain-containing protein [Methylococcales bacterium]
MQYSCLIFTAFRSPVLLLVCIVFSLGSVLSAHELESSVSQEITEDSFHDDRAPTIEEEAQIIERAERERIGYNPELSTATRITALSASAQNEGQWGGVEGWPLVPVFVSLLHDGRILAFDSVGDAPTESFPNHTFTRATIWDPVTSQFTDVRVDTGYNLFCSGFASLPDGQLFIAGGNADAGLNGLRETHLFSSSAPNWSVGVDMSFTRWYPSVTPLANGEMLITGGGPATSEVRQTNGQIRLLSSAAQNYWAHREYPWLQTAPDGRVAFFGPDTQLGYVTTSGSGAWQNTIRRDNAKRSYGSYAMYDIGKVLIAGGGHQSSVHSQQSSVVIDLHNNTVSSTDSMAFRRRQHNLTILADGSVLATGGYSSNAGLVDLTNAVYTPELWNPDTETWVSLASESRARQYHSIALLLPDARVLSAGGGICGTCQQVGYLQKNAEIFSPPYLFRADGSGQLASRPVIENTPDEIGYSWQIIVETPQASEILKVGLVRTGSVTHSQNMEQRYIPLSFIPRNGALEVTTPDSANIAPPGHYMLFIIDNAGVPSVSKMLRVDDIDEALQVSAGSDQTIVLPAELRLNGTVPSGSTNIWSQISGPGTASFVDSNDEDTSVNFDVSGTYVLRLTVNKGNLTAFDEITVTVNRGDDTGDSTTIQEVRVSTGSDDAEEKPDGRVITGSSDLDLVASGGSQTVGIRFNGLTIPRGATIVNAYIQFTAANTRSSTTSLTLKGEAADNAATFLRVNNNVSSRPVTTASVSWSPVPWTVAGGAGIDQRTPNLTPIIQEIVNRSNWISSHSLAIIIAGTGKREGIAFEGNSATAPVLHVEFSGMAGTGNQPPTASITAPTDGTNATFGDSITFTGSALDTEDGDVSASLSWTSNLDGTIGSGASFSISVLSEGTHTITATATDGDSLTSSDSITVNVLAAGGGTTRLSIPISSGSDDIEEKADGNVIVGSTDLDLVASGGNQTIGMRFNTVNIPQGSTIVSAYIQFTAAKARSTTTSLTLKGEAADNATTFLKVSNNLSTRPTTNASVSWAPVPWTASGDAGVDQRTPNLTSIVQEIVNRTNWTNNHSLAIIVTGSGKREATSFEANASAAPVLHLEFQQ